MFAVGTETGVTYVVSTYLDYNFLLVCVHVIFRI